jgi:hypothetical protein
MAKDVGRVRIMRFTGTAHTCLESVPLYFAILSRDAVDPLRWVALAVQQFCTPLMSRLYKHSIPARQKVRDL